MTSSSTCVRAEGALQRRPPSLRQSWLRGGKPRPRRVSDPFAADVLIGDDGIAVAFAETTPVRSPLFEAIPVRQCSRSIYDGHPLAAKELHTLENVAQGEGAHAIVMTAAPQIETVLDDDTGSRSAAATNGLPCKRPHSGSARRF